MGLLPQRTDSELQAEVQSFLAFIEDCQRTGRRFKNLRLFANEYGFRGL